MKVSAAAIEMPLSRRVMYRSYYLLSCLHYWFKIIYSQLNCTRAYKNHNLKMIVLLTICLFLYHKNLKKTMGCVQGMTTRTIKPMKFYTRRKTKDGSATDELLLLVSQKSEENQGWYLGNDNGNNEINKSLCLTSFVYICFYHKGFYHCNKDHTVACV